MGQTAVEWLQELIECGADLEQIKKFLPKAKEMEKQQIGEAYEDGYSDSDNTFELNKEYYNEKFKNQLQG